MFAVLRAKREGPYPFRITLDACDNGVSNSDETLQTSVSQFYDSGQGSPVTTWAEMLSYRARSSSCEAVSHKHEHQTCYSLVAVSKLCTKVHDNKIGVLTCPRLMCNKKLQLSAP